MGEFYLFWMVGFLASGRFWLFQNQEENIHCGLRRVMIASMYCWALHSVYSPSVVPQRCIFTLFRPVKKFAFFALIVSKFSRSFVAVFSFFIFSYFHILLSMLDFFISNCCKGHIIALIKADKSQKILSFFPSSKYDWNNCLAH